MFDPNHNHHKRRFLLFLLFPILFFGFVGIVMFLWNAILPKVTGAGVITYWQAMGLLVLCRILFGGNHMGGKHKNHNLGGGPGNQWRQKWMGMSDEERARFKERWKQRCGDNRNRE